MKNISLLLASVIFLSVLTGSCKSGNHKIANPFAGKMVFDSIREYSCIKDSTQKYAAYLPSAYTANKKWPVIYLFDPHADGKLPLQKMKEAAERFGYILVGSENFRNGEINVPGIAAALFEDTRSRFSIDDQRVYLAGFSGGGRVAGSLALTTRGIRGIIIAGSAIHQLQSELKSRGFIVYGLAGLGDFNLIEVRAMDKELTSLAIPHYVSIFNGKHEWPSAEELSWAIMWIEFQAMREKLIPLNTPEINWILNYTDSTTSLLNKTGLSAQAIQKYQYAISSLQGLVNIKALEKQMNQILESAQYQAYRKNEEMMNLKEQKLQSEYANAILNKDEKWWSNEINVLVEKCNTEKDPIKLGMYNRLRGYLGILSYSYTSRGVSSGNQKEAERLIGIYRIIEPNNPDWMYYQALLYDKEGNTAKAIDMLKQSIGKGLGDKGRIRRDFSKLVQKAVE